jgi:cyclophilin family peptidyl-prolyl cis-trans isomerase
MLQRTYFIFVATGLLGIASCTPADTGKPASNSKQPVAAESGTPAPEKDTPVVVIETSMGTIKVELNPVKAPITVKNFLSYVDDKHYDGTVFHRVIPNFMIQGGGFDERLKEKKAKPEIKNEAGNGLSNVRGTIAMARKGDPDSASAQFYINTEDNSRGLDRSGPAPQQAGYTVFGKVVSGMDTVDKIAAVRTGVKVLTNDDGQSGPSKDVPVENVVIKSIRRADK